MVSAFSLLCIFLTEVFLIVLNSMLNVMQLVPLTQLAQ